MEIITTMAGLLIIAIGFYIVAVMQQNQLEKLIDSAQELAEDNDFLKTSYDALFDAYGYLSVEYDLLKSGVDVRAKAENEQVTTAGDLDLNRAKNLLDIAMTNKKISKNLYNELISCM